MKIIYIAHPVGGDVEGNIHRILAIVKTINLEEPDAVPFVPYLADIMAMDDNIPEHRARGIKNDSALIEAGFINECRLYGDRISAGMIAEVFAFQSLGVPVVPMTPETKEQFKHYSHL